MVALPTSAYPALKCCRCPSDCSLCLLFALCLIFAPIFTSTKSHGCCAGLAQSRRTKEIKSNGQAEQQTVTHIYKKLANLPFCNNVKETLKTIVMGI